MQQQSEFDCVVKAFIYLAAYLPRHELLEPVMDEAFQQILLGMKNLISMSAGQGASSFFGQDIDMNSIEAALGRSSSPAAAVAAPLSEAEPDMFPCLVVICGSAFAFLKVSEDRYSQACSHIFYLVHR